MAGLEGGKSRRLFDGWAEAKPEERGRKEEKGRREGKARRARERLGWVRNSPSLCYRIYRGETRTES